ncbi:MAG: queuosine salvage family protein [Desulfobacterales bacterium]|jgi:hypothetical protein
MINLLQQVRSACQTVAERARHVQINYDLIPTYARSLPIEKTGVPGHDPASHFLGQNENTAIFFLTLDTINFGSGYFPQLDKRPGKSGYFTIASCLNDLFKKRGPLSAEALKQLTPKDCTRIFEQDPANKPVGELMQLFAKALNDLGGYVQEDFSGSFKALIMAAAGSAERMIKLLLRMPYFDDVQLYDKIEVPFYKRAQLTVADLSLAFAGKGLGRFDDLENLTIFADNLVPHVLRVDSILLYEEELGSHIDAGKRVAAGSVQEIEIRACALYAVELLKNELIRSGHQLTSMGLDFLLWNRGQQPVYKSIPRHRSRTVFY